MKGFKGNVRNFSPTKTFTVYNLTVLGSVSRSPVRHIFLWQRFIWTKRNLYLVNQKSVLAQEEWSEVNTFGTQNHSRDFVLLRSLQAICQADIEYSYDWELTVDTERCLTFGCVWGQEVSVFDIICSVDLQQLHNVKCISTFCIYKW